MKCKNCGKSEFLIGTLFGPVSLDKIDEIHKGDTIECRNCGAKFVCLSVNESNTRTWKELTNKDKKCFR